MQVLVISDTHGDGAVVRLLLNRYKHKVQTVVHLGDNDKDLLQFESGFPALNFVAVAGNCDYYTSTPKERILTLGTSVYRRVLLLHGHSLNIKSSYDRLMYYAQEKGVDACLFGHTHMPFVHRSESVFFMNPGSAGEPRGGSKAGYGLLTIDEEGNLTGEVHEL